MRKTILAGLLLAASAYAADVTVIDCGFPFSQVETNMYIQTWRENDRTSMSCEPLGLVPTCTCKANTKCTAYILDSDAETNIACVETRRLLFTSQSTVLKIVKVR